MRMVTDMARIRTIKPELPQSESMGKVSRDARLLFILMWTLADDEGRLRGSSRMLASLLFPYDDDAPGLIDKWVAELSHEQCISVYSVDGSTYIQIAKWLNHQKIDRPTQSKIPSFDEAPRILANARDRTKDQGPKDQGPKEGTEEITGEPEDDEKPRGVTSVDLSIAMRAGGVMTQPADPRLIALAAQGIDAETVAAACEEAKRSKPNTRLGAGYILAILERWAAEAAAMKAAGAKPPRPGQSGVQAGKFTFSDTDRSADHAAQAASMARHGVVVPEGEVEF